MSYLKYYIVKIDFDWGLWLEKWFLENFLIIKNIEYKNNKSFNHDYNFNLYINILRKFLKILNKLIK